MIGEILEAVGTTAVEIVAEGVAEVVTNVAGDTLSGFLGQPTGVTKDEMESGSTSLDLDKK